MKRRWHVQKMLLTMLAGAIAAWLSGVIELTAQGGANVMEEGKALYQQGKFDEAEKAFRKALQAEPENVDAQRRLGVVLLWANRLDEAIACLSKAAQKDPRAKGALALAYYRNDEFEPAAKLYAELGAKAMSAKLSAFGSEPPYQVEGGKVSAVKFVVTDPLPVVSLKVNGTQADFFIDTGGAELILEEEFANQVGAKRFGSETGTFAGGQQTAYEHGKVDTVTIGEFVVRHVPVHIMNLKPAASIFGGRQVRGVIGTLFLAHFIATIDYKGGQLVLRRKSKENLKALGTKKEQIIRFWMAGDHYIVAWGSLNKAPTLWFVDTGLAGPHFAPSDSTVKEVKIALDESKTVEGQGAAGKVRLIPFFADELGLGDVKIEKPLGYAGIFPPSLENAFGFRIGGMVGHAFFRQRAVTFDFMGMRLFVE